MSNESNLSILTELKGFTAEETRAVALKALTGIVLGTPVDEGRARGNWQLSEGQPIMTDVDLLDKGGSVAINKGVSVIQANRLKDYMVFWITNNLPYIVPLNNGSSKQAPKFFVETAIKIAAR